MIKKRDDLPYGPGGTFWYENEDGGISICSHNDEHWCSTFVSSKKLDHKRALPGYICRWLRDAYEAGMKDAKAQIRQTLGVK